MERFEMARQGLVVNNTAGPFCFYADAQATIAALQARVKELCKFRQADHEQLVEVQKYWRESQDEVHELQSQLTQRTAELEAANKLLYRKNCELGRFETMISDLQAELARVRGELVEAKDFLNTVTNDLNETAKERDDLRALIAALPKVEGEISERFCTGSYYSSPYDYRSHVTFETALVALLKHRQGME